MHAERDIVTANPSVRLTSVLVLVLERSQLYVIITMTVRRLLNLAAKEEMFSTDHCVVNNNVERTGL